MSPAATALLGAHRRARDHRRRLQSALARATRERGRFHRIERVVDRGALSRALARSVEAIAGKRAAARISG